MESRTLVGITIQPVHLGTVVLAHGAGGHRNHPHIVDLETLLIKAGFSVFRFNFPFTAEGRRLPDSMPVLRNAFKSAIDEAIHEIKKGIKSQSQSQPQSQKIKREPVDPARSIFLAGHSMGGRVASLLVADGLPCQGLLLFSYPLHPPGKPEKLRRDHFQKISVPVLSLSGTRDAFCTVNLMQETVLPLKDFWTHHWLEGADHGFQVLKRSGRTREEILTEAGIAIERFKLNLDDGTI